MCETFAASFSITVSINDFFSGNFISVTICYDISDLHFIPSNHRAMRPLKLVYRDTLQFLNTEMRFSLTQTKTFHVSKSQTWRTIGNDPQSKRSNLNPRACMHANIPTVCGGNLLRPRGSGPHQKTLGISRGFRFHHAITQTTIKFMEYSCV